MSVDRWVVCEQCDAVHARRELQPGEVADCVRCGHQLYRHHRFDVEMLLALTLTTAIAFLLANVYPIIALDAQGAYNAATIWGAVIATWESGVAPVAFIAALLVFFFPLAQILLFAYVLLGLHGGRRPGEFRQAMHALSLMQPWSMAEVFMLGILVAIVKLQGVMTVIPGIGLWSFAVLTLLLAALTSYDLQDLWDIAERLDGDGGPVAREPA
ncbi:paraquat-inducible protein A [Solimonas sp. K1W22B-7]|uniref:paraquat-inducible protein A n=1 Tax=Solimonas sp. K1W22B-7 TaxID=2303331 RepID=UPI000E32FC7C|nr:paraquat-inducible protein A [Solimonas sp. K1W22B-7]AXQ29586.1 paraquat-inducible protein A [Solimonas sp. K1W22B-7]